MITDKVKILKAFVSLALTQATDEVKTEMLREMNFSFKTYIQKEFNVDVTMIQPAPSFDYDNDDSSECQSYLEFKSDDLSVVVALEGNWSSYEGYEYDRWYFCKPQPVTKLEYIRE